MGFGQALPQHRAIVPSCRVYNSGNIATANGAVTALTFDSERWDTDGMHSVAANTNRITIRTPGIYLVGGNIQWEFSIVGVRDHAILLNGVVADRIAYVNLPAGGSSDPDTNINTIWDCTAGDYFEQLVRQTSGGWLNITNHKKCSPEFWCHRLA